MFEGTLIVLRSDRDEITLTAYRRVTAISRPRGEHLAHGGAWRGFHDHRSPSRTQPPQPPRTEHLPGPCRYPITATRLKRPS